MPLCYKNYWNILFLNKPSKILLKINLSHIFFAALSEKLLHFSLRLIVFITADITEKRHPRETWSKTVNFDTYLSSNTTTENGGMVTLRLFPLLVAPLKTAGLIFSGFSKELKSCSFADDKILPATDL